MGGVLGKNSPLCPEPLDMPSLAFTVPFCDCEAMVQEARTVLRAFPRRADDPRQASLSGRQGVRVHLHRPGLGRWERGLWAPARG